MNINIISPNLITKIVGFSYSKTFYHSEGNLALSISLQKWYKMVIDFGHLK